MLYQVLFLVKHILHIKVLLQNKNIFYCFQLIGEEFVDVYVHFC